MTITTYAKNKDCLPLPWRSMKSHPGKRVESLNGAAVLPIGISSKGDIVLVLLNPDMATMPEKVEFLPGSVEHGCWVHVPEHEHWVRLPVFTVPSAVPGLSLSAAGRRLVKQD